MKVRRGDRFNLRTQGLALARVTTKHGVRPGDFVVISGLEMERNTPLYTLGRRTRTPGRSVTPVARCLDLGGTAGDIVTVDVGTFGGDITNWLMARGIIR